MRAASQLSILLVGTGALATLFAARLSAAGHRVAMMGTWKDGLRAPSENGARVVDDSGQERAFGVRASAAPGEFSNIRHAIALVKSWQTERVAQTLGGILAPDGVVLTLQNGLGNREAFARALGPSGCACRFPIRSQP